MTSIILVIILAIVIQCVDGNQRIMQVSELLSDDEDLYGSGEDNSSLSCCVYGNCSCTSLDHALAHLTNNVMINITTDVMLSSLIEVTGLQNVSIVGYNNPTVNCNNFGGLQFTFCHNCIIQGITWDGCGTKNNDTNAKPVLRLSYSSNITIQNCSFQHSIGQAVVLSEVSGDVNINHCQFVYNSHYRGHGAAVHYSSNDVTNHHQSLLTIRNCNFSYNKDAKSLVYVKNRIFQHSKLNNIVFHCSKFCHNQGVTSIFIKNQRISLSGDHLFQNNTAKYGAGIYITDHSTISFGENSDVSFIQNSAKYKGGAILLNNHSVVLFDENSKTNFSYNKVIKVIAAGYGAAIYSFNNSHVIFTGKHYEMF